MMIAYLAIVIAAVVERNYPRALYYVGAIVISLAVLWMSHQGGTR